LLGRAKVDSLVDAAFATMEDESGHDDVVGVTMLVFEVRGADGVTSFYTFCNDKREWIQRAAIEEARQAIEFAEVENSD
jgi:hypothetical protein